MPSNRPPSFGPGLSQRPALCRVLPGALETLPGAALTPPLPPRSLPAPSPSPVPPRPSQDSGPFPTRHPGPAPAQLPARPAGRWYRSALISRRAPPSGPQCAGEVTSGDRGGRVGSPAGPSHARPHLPASAVSHPPGPGPGSSSPRAATLALRPL